MHLSPNDIQDRPVTDLSVGQQQRVAVARALIGRPPLIIADEPTSALDTDTRQAFLKLLFNEVQAAGSSLLFVSHDMIGIAWKSLCNRWPTALLAMLAIAMSVALILTVEKVRRDARNSFTQTISGTDLIVGARSGAVQLLLYSVFRVGNATNNISWESVEHIQQRSAVDWTIPISLGDSHRGFRVLGTNHDYFKIYRYGQKQLLEFSQGEPFDDVFDAVIGSQVAAELEYKINDSIVVAHGTGNAGLVQHDNQPFRVSGILKPTGTPVDRAVHVSLQGIEAMHVDWRNGAAVKGEGTPAEAIRQMDLEQEPLLAVLPGVALQQLWELVGVAEKALLIVSICVVVAGLVNLVSVLLAGLNERRREMAVLRSAGARPVHVFLLLCIESTVLTLAGIVTGLLLHYVLTSLGAIYIQEKFGLAIGISWPGTTELKVLSTIAVAGLFAGTLPALQAYRKSLSDGLAQKL